MLSSRAVVAIIASIACVIGIIFVALRNRKPTLIIGPVIDSRLYSLMPPIELIDAKDDIMYSPTTRAIQPRNTVWPNTNAPAIVDQGQWGSCTAFSVRYAYMLWLAKRGLPVVEPSTAFWYAKSRALLGLLPLRDMGSTTAANVAVLTTIGSLTNEQWPYTAPNIFRLPSTGTPTFAPGINAPTFFASTGTWTGFKRLPSVSATGRIPKWQNQADLFASEIDAGRAVLVSFNVYSNLNSTLLTTGVWTQPSGALRGGHAICLIGYVRGTTPDKSVFTFFNSWGSYSGYYTTTGNGTITAGIPGLFSIPFNYIANTQYASDFWSL